MYTLVTDSLTHSCLVNLINVNLACEDGNSKLVEAVVAAIADFSDGGSSWRQFVADLEA